MIYTAPESAFHPWSP